MQIKEELVDNKIYLFRGESRNSAQSNYHHKNRMPFKSRYYSYEIYDGIYAFGDVVCYELLDDSRLLDYDDSVEQFCEDYDLIDYESQYAQRAYGVSSLSRLKEYGGSIKVDYHDLYHIRQLIATEFLETKMANRYDGIVWYEWDDEPEYQVQIWNNNIVRKLTYPQAKRLIARMIELHPEIADDLKYISTGDDFDFDAKFILKK